MEGDRHLHGEDEFSNNSGVVLGQFESILQAVGKTTN